MKRSALSVVDRLGARKQYTGDLGTGLHLVDDAWIDCIVDGGGKRCG